MSRTYAVTHRTEYRYAAPVTASYGWAYLTPREVPGQNRITSAVTIEPGASISSETSDFFGNTATYFEVHVPHDRLVVTATSTASIHRAPVDVAGLQAFSISSARAALDALPASERAEAAGFQLTSPQLPAAQPVSSYASSVLDPAMDLYSALTGLMDAIFTGLEYESGATEVTTTLTEVLERRQGVCQDFAHLAVASLRWAGLAARYVSGYLETQPPPGQPKLQGADASHAWASVLVPGLGWVDFDPTNNQFVDSSYVVTAWGRDYGDVPPLKGVIFTESATSTMQVAVDVLRV